MTDKVKCSDCGMLGVRDQLSGEIIEFTKTMAAEGFYHDGTQLRPCHLVCYAQAADLHEETNHSNPTLVLKVATKKRECSKFITRLVGKKPKEHEEMEWQAVARESQSRMADAQTRIADVQAKLAELQLRYVEWRDAQATKDERFSQRVQALEETRHQEVRRDTKGLKWTEIAFICGATIAAAIISAVLTAWLVK